MTFLSCPSLFVWFRCLKRAEERVSHRRSKNSAREERKKKIKQRVSCFSFVLPKRLWSSVNRYTCTSPILVYMLLLKVFKGISVGKEWLGAPWKGIHCEKVRIANLSRPSRKPKFASKCLQRQQSQRVGVDLRDKQPSNTATQTWRWRVMASRMTTRCVRSAHIDFGRTFLLYLKDIRIGYAKTFFIFLCRCRLFWMLMPRLNRRREWTLVKWR